MSNWQVKKSPRADLWRSEAGGLRLWSLLLPRITLLRPWISHVLRHRQEPPQSGEAGEAGDTSARSKKTERSSLLGTNIFVGNSCGLRGGVVQFDDRGN